MKLLARCLLCLFWGLSVASVRGQTADWKYSTKAVRAELVKTIDAQLAAFRANNYRAAYRLASAELREEFSLPVFELMIRRGYPVIAANRSADYGLARDNGEEAEVLVTVRGPNDRTADYRYILVHEESGWKIGSVAEMTPSGPDV